MARIDRDSLIEKTMGKEIEYLTFPSHFDVALRIRKALSDYTKPIEYIAGVVKKDPVISMKILQEASRRNRDRVKVTNLATAINILGYENVKRITLAMVCKQITQSKEAIRYTALSRLIWLNSVYTASAAHVLANNYSSFDPEEAYMCGMLVNVGAFFLLYQACVTPNLKDDYDTMTHAIDRHYLDRTSDILTMFEMSQDCIAAVDVRSPPENIWSKDFKSLRELVFTANALASTSYPWVTDHEVREIDQSYIETVEEIGEMFKIMKSKD